MGSQLPSLTHVHKSQHGGKVPPSKPWEPIKVWFVSLLDYFMQKGFGTCVATWVQFLLDPILNASLEHHLQKSVDI